MAFQKSTRALLGIQKLLASSMITVYAGAFAARPERFTNRFHVTNSQMIKKNFVSKMQHAPLTDYRRYES